jgi:hypothetical protein
MGMSGGMVPLPVPPVKAPSPNCCPSPSKPFACYTSGKSLRSSTLSNATETQFDSAYCFAKSFALISFTDPHFLNSVVSYRCKNSGGRASAYRSTTRVDSSPDSANSFALNAFADPHPLNPFVSHLYKNIGGGGYRLTQNFNPFQLSKSAGRFLATEACRPEKPLCYTGT